MEDIETRRDTFKEPQISLFSSDSGSEASSQSSITTKSRDDGPDCEKPKIDFSNFSNLFIKQIDDTVSEPDIVSSNIMTDYSSFVRKLNLKRKLHK